MTEAMPRRQATPKQAAPGWNHAKFETLYQEWLAANPGRTPTDFASTAGISVSELHRLRRPGADLSFRRALKIARALKVPLDDLALDAT
jgi:hypothetical protein